MPLSRRRFLQLGGAAAVGAGVAATGVRVGTGAAAPADSSSVVIAPFHGVHQAALVAEPAPATVFTSFDVTAENATELRDLLRTITERLRLLSEGGAPVDLGPAAPPDDNGILGPAIPPQSVASIVGVGASLFDERFGLASRKPAHLTPMKTFPNDNLKPAECHGDVSVQFNAAESDIAIHALRDLTKHTRGGMQPRWRIEGFVSPRDPRGHRATCSASATGPRIPTSPTPRPRAGCCGSAGSHPSRRGRRTARIKWRASSGISWSSGTVCR